MRYRYLHSPEHSLQPFSLYLALLFAFLWTPVAWTRFVDLVVDDTALHYDVNGSWKPQACEGCSSLPILSSARSGSWHESLYVPGGDIPLAWLNFTGQSPPKHWY